MQQVFSFDTSGRQIDAAGNFIRYDRETSGALDDSIRVRVNGQDLGVWRPGDAAELPEEFRSINIEVLGDAQGEIRVGRGRFNSSRMQLSGNVGASIVANRAVQSNVFVNTQKTVTNASAQLIAANADRQYLLIQNKSATGTIWLRFGGAAATQAIGIKLGPGAFWEWDSTIPTGEVRAIGDIASNADVVVLEG